MTALCVAWRAVIHVPNRADPGDVVLKSNGDTYALVKRLFALGGLLIPPFLQAADTILPLLPAAMDADTLSE